MCLTPVRMAPYGLPCITKKPRAMRGFLALKKWSGTYDLQHKKRLTHRHRLKIFTANNHYERSKVPVVPVMSMTSPQPLSKGAGSRVLMLLIYVIMQKLIVA
jgi:hypothetical protein